MRGAGFVLAGVAVTTLAAAMVAGAVVVGGPSSCTPDDSGAVVCDPASRPAPALYPKTASGETYGSSVNAVSPRD